VLLRRVSMGQVMYSPNYKAFISLMTNKADVQLPVQAEEYADLMGRLCESLAVFADYRLIFYRLFSHLLMSISQIYILLLLKGFC
jgi:hypothetical protein